MSQTIHPPQYRPAGAPDVLVWCATAGAVALLGCVLAYWTLAWLAPSPIARLPSLAQEPVGAAAARNLFGTASERVQPPVGGSAIRLMGVVAPSGRERGYALVQIDGRPGVTVRKGAAIAPGIVLAEVHANHIVLDRAGTREVLTWPDGAGPLARPAQAR